MANVKENIELEDNRLDKKVKIKSIAPWVTGSPRKTSTGDISIPASGSILLTREEVIAQAQNGNKLISGVDGLGSHATWYIEDEFTRKELSFEIDGKPQAFLTHDDINRYFSLKTQRSFEDNITKNIVTRAEKAFLIESIKALGLNDYQKIAFCIEYTGIKP
ncbi:hypothetical protein GKG47_08885 [Lactonifactor sp. BIOML-A3]|uniref:hypothetical protein n=1 Tax=unclassified Lactonifactor TaxID=2636670 RepID=UPI0012AF1295|nr:MULTISPECIES: hypothetical protein [unclassified Lactonifactor]MSA02155.1 hypothetical protein [Lactonifactor sp. BIOML-A5]MSA07940.1 hypothetical protein [Lactonifactor sp. BIOML-A4]MSA12556.1 hypothetical protein [Lactonifactor sp. BIOML-A3]MSA16743.1 hypothetical protein [Lactonifactor sp. BIOML-A2]MSA37558.1 hypothetical protein [Lactonifactor sp. BIOML-A1]